MIPTTAKYYGFLTCLLRAGLLQHVPGLKILPKMPSRNLHMFPDLSEGAFVDLLQTVEVCMFLV